ncbi:helix-turn-helix transcriptional regulator [Mucilaginibacter sp. AW1-3]
MNRIDRITAILIQLQSKRVVKAHDIASRFNISLRTVYRDVKTLEEAGIPIIGEAGIGYSIMDGYRLPPVMFTKEEAIAFLTAEKFMDKLTDTISGASYSSAMYKIKAVLKATEKDFLEQLDNNIEVVKSRKTEHTNLDINPIQDILIEGISQKKVLSIQYFANHSQQKTKRLVEPVGIFYLDNFWHLIAWCRLRNDYRDFRIDRISDLVVTDTVFKQEHPTLKQHLDKVTEARNLQTVIIRIDKQAVPFISGQKYYSGFVSEREVDDKVEMTFLTGSIEGFARWYMMFADYAEIVSNDHLIYKIESILTKVNMQFEKNSALG